ncbi:unnamed protein product [Brassica oleracea]
MADPELEAIRQRRMQELMAQHGTGKQGNQQNPDQERAQEDAKREADERRQMMLSQILSSQARERIARIALVKPDKARGVEDVILRAAQMGQIVEKVSEERLITLLEQINSQTSKQTKVTVRSHNPPKTQVIKAKSFALSLTISLSVSLSWMCLLFTDPETSWGGRRLERRRLCCAFVYLWRSHC